MSKCLVCGEVMEGEDRYITVREVDVGEFPWPMSGKHAVGEKAGLVHLAVRENPDITAHATGK